MKENEFRDKIIKEHFEEEKQMALLLLGKGAYEKLKFLYEGVDPRIYDKDWIENPKKPTDFWDGLLRGTKSNPKLVEETLEQWKKGIKVVPLVRDILRDLDYRHHLFIPNIDKMFYKFDVQEDANLNARLRSIWQTQISKLNIYASAENSDSEEYKATLGKYMFPFFIGNFDVHLV